MLLVTLVTPSFNQGFFIEKTILSVLNQTYFNIQYIIIDGGSTDNTMSIIEKYRDKIDIIIHEKDKGQADAINKGFKLAKGELVGWLNSDDILYPDCVEAIVNLCSKNISASIFYNSKNDIIDENDNIINTYQHIIPNKEHLLKFNYNIIQPGSFYKKDIVEKVGFLNIENYYCMDLDLWLKLLNHGEIVFTTDAPHAGFRIYEGTKTDTGKERFLKNIYLVLLQHGAKRYYPSVFYRIYWFWFKIIIKRFILSIIK